MTAAIDPRGVLELLAGGGAVRRPRIVLAEDEQVVAAELAAELAALGFDIAGVATTGGDALALVERCAPDLVLMDIQLAGPMNGIEAAHELRRRWQLPVVFLSGHAGGEIVARARAAGPLGFLTKPFRIDELNATLVMALHQHQLARDLFAAHGWLTSLLASLGDGVIATDADGLVRLLNPIAEALTGWSQAEAIGRPIEDVCAKATLSGEPVIEGPLRLALRTGAPTGEQRVLLLNHRDRPLAIEESAAPIRSGPRVLGAVTIFRDISERLLEEREEAARRTWLEDQVHTTSEALGRTRAELRALAAHLLTTQENERRRVARELHDDLGQRAALLDLKLDRAEQLLAGGHDAARDVLAELRADVRGLGGALRDVSRRLHPAALEDLGLLAALRALVDEHRRRGAEVALTLRDVPDALPLDLATALYRVAQEALSNARRHAPGAPVRVSLAGTDSELRLLVEDAGPGFDLERVRGQGGLGLLSMQERARLVGGVLLVRTRPGAGTCIAVRAPLRGAA